MSKNDIAIPVVAAAMDNLRLAIGRMVGALRDLDLTELPQENRTAIQYILDHADDTSSIKEFDHDGMYGRTARATRGIFTLHANRKEGITVTDPREDMAKLAAQTFNAPPGSNATTKLQQAGAAHLAAFAAVNQCCTLLQEVAKENPEMHVSEKAQLLQVLEGMGEIARMLDGHKTPKGNDTYAGINRLQAVAQRVRR